MRLGVHTGSPQRARMKVTGTGIIVIARKTRHGKGSIVAPAWPALLTHGRQVPRAWTGPQCPQDGAPWSRASRGWGFPGRSLPSPVRAVSQKPGSRLDQGSWWQRWPPVRSPGPLFLSPPLRGSGSSHHPTRLCPQRDQHLLAGWPEGVGGTRPRDPASGAPRECPPAHQVVKRSQSMSSGGQVLHKKTDENKPEAASCVRAASAKRQQLLQGWAARPSREGDLGTESRSRGAARGGASTCEGPGQGGGPAGPGGRGGHRARAGQTQAGQASGASWCRTGHWRDT